MNQLRFRNKRLKNLYERDMRRGFPDRHVTELREMFTYLQRAEEPADMSIPRWRFKEMQGDMRGVFRLRIDRRWRLLFRWDELGPYQIDYVDDH